MRISLDSFFMYFTSKWIEHQPASIRKGRTFPPWHRDTESSVCVGFLSLGCANIKLLFLPAWPSNENSNARPGCRGRCGHDGCKPPYRSQLRTRVQLKPMASSRWERARPCGSACALPNL